MNSQKTPHISPFRASYGVSFMSTSTEIDRVIKGFYCTTVMQSFPWLLAMAKYKKSLVSSLIIQLWSKSSRKPIGPSDIVPDFAKCLMICSKSSDMLCDHLQTFSWMIEFKCLIIFFQKCLMISYKSSDILDHRDCHQISNIRHTVVGNTNC